MAISLRNHVGIILVHLHVRTGTAQETYFDPLSLTPEYFPEPPGVLPI